MICIIELMQLQMKKKKKMLMTAKSQQEPGKGKEGFFSSAHGGSKVLPTSSFQTSVPRAMRKLIFIVYATKFVIISDSNLGN